jgi:actinin alpha
MSSDRTWETIQKKTFTGWCNSHLRKRNQVIEKIETDFSNGLKLIQLLEIISDEQFNYKYDKKPNLRIQQVGNVNSCLKFISDKGVKLAGIGAEEVVDGNLKMILGMVWTIILRFQIQDISMEDLSAKEGLLLWCQKKTAGYPGVNVKNFHLSFQDGLAFCALIHKHRPDLLDWDGLDKTNKALCLQTAFDVAEKHLDVPKLLDPDDLLNVAKPDERSVMTYVALYYHVFSSSQKAETAGKRVAKVIDFVEANDRVKNDYLNRAQKLVDWINATTGNLNERDFDNTLEGVVSKIEDLKGFKTNDKPPRFNDKVVLEALISGLQTKLNLNNRPAFVPPAGLSSAEIDALWNNMEHAEHERSIALRNELRRMKRINDLLRRFLALAAKLDAWGSDRNTYLNSTDYGNTISAVLAKLKNLEAFESEYVAQSNRVARLKDYARQLDELQYNDMGTINGRVSNIDGVWGDLRSSADNRKSALEAHLARLQEIENNLLGFAKSSLEFKVWLEGADETFTDPVSVETVEAIDAIIGSFEQAVVEKDAKAAEFNALEDLAASLRAAGVSEDTFSEVSIDYLRDYWNRVAALIDTRRAELGNERARQEEDERVRVEFAQKAQAFVDFVAGQSHAIDSLSGSIDDQLNALNSITSESNATGNNLFDEVIAIAQTGEQRQITDNPHTELSVESLKSKFDSLNVLIKNKGQVLERERLAQTHSGLSADQIKEFKECFLHFDKDNDNLLNRLELGACLKSLGEDVTFEQGSKLDTILGSIDGDGDGKVTFEEFAGYMERTSSGSDTPDSIKLAFKTLAGDKDFVTEADLRAVLDAEKVTYCLAHMQPYPGVPNAYDYNTFTDSLYGQ